MRITIDSERCTGHGRCYSVAPALFESDEEGFGIVSIPEVSDDLQDSARLAAANCPELAIHLTD